MEAYTHLTSNYRKISLNNLYFKIKKGVKFNPTPYNTWQNITTTVES